MLLLTFCCSMPSFLPHDHYRKMCGSMTFGFFTWPVAISCQDSSPQEFFGFYLFTMHCRALLGLKLGVEGLFTSLFSVSNVYSVVIDVTESFQLSPSSFHLLSAFIFPFYFMLFCTFICLVRSPVFFLGSVWQ